MQHIKIEGKSYSWTDLTPFLIASGTERFCFVNPENPDQLLKLSRKTRCKQTKRELRYFQFLQKKKVPFLYLPTFYKAVNTADFCGFVQQTVRNKNGDLAPSLHQYLSTGEKINKQQLSDLFCYLYHYNILPCDLNQHNILVQTKETQKLILIDGLGCTDFMPLAQFWPWWGRRKIVRKFIRFIQENESLRAVFSNNQEIKKEVLSWAKNLPQAKVGD